MKVHIEGRGERQLPDFFILGAAKAGTSALHFLLDEHPDIFMPHVKEPWFLSGSAVPDTDPDSARFHIPGMVESLDDYSALYDNARPGQLLGDASPSYLYTHEATIPNIKALYAENDAWKKLRFIVSLRNPVDRIWSHYWTIRRELRETLPFDEAITSAVVAGRITESRDPFFDYVGFGMYSAQYRAYGEAFGYDKIHVVMFDEFRSAQARVCQGIFDFLGVDKNFVPQRTGVRFNYSGMPRSVFLTRLIRKPSLVKGMLKVALPRRLRKGIKHYLTGKILKKVSMTPEQRRSVSALYADEITQLERMLGRELSEWRATA